MNQLFLAVALLRLAEKSAGCVDLKDDEECENRVYGMRPSSLLTTATSATGVLGALILPPIGALIDRSPRRRGVGIATSIIIVFLSASNLMISEHTWFIVLMLSVAGSIFYFIHLMVLYSYVPELSDNVEQLTSYNGSYIAIRTAVMVPILPLVLGTAFLVNQRSQYEVGSLEFDVLLAKIAQIVTFILSTLFFTLTFYKGLKARPPKIKSGDVSNKIKISETALEIFRYNRPLFWYLLALIPLANTAMAFGSISLTFMTIFLSMGSLQIGMTIIIFTFFGVLGSKIHPLIAKKINLMNDLKLNVIGWTVACILTGSLVHKPGLKIRFIIISVLWGFVFGWSVPSMRTVYITLIPAGQEAEYMGIYILFSGGFVWLPPLLFTILNEVGIRMNYIIMIASLLFVLTLGLLFLVGDYQKAAENAKTLGAKYQRRKEEMSAESEISTTAGKENELSDKVPGDVEANDESQTESVDSLDNQHALET